MVAARQRSNNQLATKDGIWRTNGGLHLAEEMQVVAAHWQNAVSTFQMNLRRFVVMPLHVADRAQIDDDRSVDLRELLCIELSEQLFQRRPHHRLDGFPSVAPGDEGVLRVGAKVVDVVDRDEAQGFARLRPDPSQGLFPAAATLQLGELLAQLLQ